MNIGSEEMVTINSLAMMIMAIANKNLSLRHVSGPLGVRGRNSHNSLIRKMLGWAPTQSLRAGLERTYPWIESQVMRLRGRNTPVPTEGTAVRQLTPAIIG